MTGDALYCDLGFCQDVLSRGGQYLLVVKHNQSTLYEDIEYLFADPPLGETFGYAESGGRHGDRREVRRCWVSGELSEYLAWPGLRQVGKVERLTTRRGKESRQVRYFITSLDTTVNPKSILDHVRGHWGIETDSTMCATSHWARTPARFTVTPHPR